QGRFLQANGRAAWPDGTVTAGYRFRHALYQDIVYRRLPPERQSRWHARIGTRLAAGYGTQASAHAAAVAGHLVRGPGAPRAVPYLQQAAQNALQRHGYQEAIGHLTHGLEVLASLPETPTRAQQELDLQMRLGAALMDTKGYAAPDVEQAFVRARALCQQVRD